MGVQTPVAAPVVQAPSQISCITTQETIWDTQYIEKTEKECHQEQIQKFRQACQTVYKNSCQTVNKQVCSKQYRQESQPYTETECSSQQKTDCESRWEEDGYGGKKWVEVGTISFLFIHSYFSAAEYNTVFQSHREPL